MSTRAHIIVKNENTKCYVYHHFDGYPEGVGKELRKYMQDTIHTNDPEQFCQDLEDLDPNYEFENYGLHGDEDYIYVIDFANNTYTCYDPFERADGSDYYGFDIPEECVYKCKKEFEYPIIEDNTPDKDTEDLITVLKGYAETNTSFIKYINEVNKKILDTIDKLSNNK